MTGRRRTRTGLAVVALSLALLAGCSDDGGSDGAAEPVASSTTPAASSTTAFPAPDYDAAEATEEAYATELAEGLSGGSADQGQIVVTPEQAACIAPVWVRTITVAALQAAEVAPGILADPAFTFGGLGLGEAEGEAMVDAYEPCGADLYGLFAVALTPDQPLPVQTCAVAGLDHDLARTALVAGITQSEALTDALNAVAQQLVDTCQPGG